MKKLSNFSKVLLGLTAAIVLFTTLTGNDRHTTDKSKATATVMITNLEGTSGGTGVVLNSSNAESDILTNSHVCNLAKNGALIRNEHTSGFATSFYQSEIHDLCLIKVSANFHTNTAVAKEAPSVYSKAFVSGHPHLLPTLITTGNFSSKQIVSVMTGFRPCTEDDLKDPTAGFICALIGRFPVIRNYESQVVGATIQAGNSGSAVYNERGEVAGLVFAGGGDFSYGMIVPQEYVQNFLNNEVPGARFLKPNTIIGIDLGSNSSRKMLKIGCLRLILGDMSLEPLSKFCKMQMNDLIYTK